MPPASGPITHSGRSIGCAKLVKTGADDPANGIRTSGCLCGSAADTRYESSRRQPGSKADERSHHRLIRHDQLPTRSQPFGYDSVVEGGSETRNDCCFANHIPDCLWGIVSQPDLKRHGPEGRRGVMSRIRPQCAQDQHPRAVQPYRREANGSSHSWVGLHSCLPHEPSLPRQLWIRRWQRSQSPMLTSPISKCFLFPYCFSGLSA